jgi:hypothetical protein
VRIHHVDMDEVGMALDQLYLGGEVRQVGGQIDAASCPADNPIRRGGGIREERGPRFVSGQNIASHAWR